MVRKYFATNLLSACFVVWIAFTVYARYIHPTASKISIPSQLQKGASLRAIDSTRWEDARYTVILFLSTSCHFCNESMPFYKHLIADAPPNVRILAYFPESVGSATAHLRDYSVVPSAVQQVEFVKYGIKGTPTLSIVSSTGVVDKTFLGSLSEATQSEIYERLGMMPGQRDSGALYAQPILLEKLAVLLRSGKGSLVDIRERELFRESHIRGAINIPLDELEARAPHELAPDTSIVLYCEYCGTCENKLAHEGVSSTCSAAVNVLRKAGYLHMNILTDSIREASRHGIQIEGR